MSELDLQRRRAIDVLTLGETMVAMRNDSPMRSGARFEVSVAGSESNTAIGLARMGHSVAWVSRLGADSLGDLVLREVRGNGVDVSLVERDDSRPTGMMLTQAVAGGLSVDYRRSGSAASAMSAADVQWAAQRFQPRVVLVTGITSALSSSCAGAVEAALTEFSHSVIVLVVNHRSTLWSTSRAAERLRPLLDRVQVVVTSEEERTVIDDGHEESVGMRLATRGVELVALTKGSRGAQLWTPRLGWTYAEPLHVPVVDTMGAGDAFTAGLLSGLLDGVSPQDALNRAVLLASHNVATRGDYEGAPTRETLGLAAPDRTAR